jgi:SAM-dependent methyltransferase
MSLSRGELTFARFLQFEQEVFGNNYPVATYDPYLIRYGEYKFLLENLPWLAGQTILDLGCESNIFMLFLASQGCRIIGVDIDPDAEKKLMDKKEFVEKALGRPLDVIYRVEDATALTLEPNSIDHAIAVSSIEHMFSKNGHGDALAIESLARVMKSGGIAIVTVPVSQNGPFHESPTGDARFGYSYRLYTPEALHERLMSNPLMPVVKHNYLSFRTPDYRFSNLEFAMFWIHRLSTEDRQKWSWANQMLCEIFNPVVSAQEGEADIAMTNTALLCLRKADRHK